MFYRFDSTAKWQSAIVSNDNQEIRPAVKGVEFRCFEQTLKVKGQTTIIDGASGMTAAITLQTDNGRVVDMKVDDYVEYKGHTYTVISVGSVRSTLYKGAREYLIGLQ